MRRTTLAAGITGCVVGALFGLTTAAFGARPNGGTMSLNQGSSLNIRCANAGKLWNSNVAASSETVNCAAPAATTTTSTPSQTTTTVPQTTTTVPKATTTTTGGGGGGGGSGSVCTNPTFQTSNPNGGESSGGFYVHNDAWNTSVAGPQTLYVCNYNSWYAISNQPNTTEVKTYPNVHKDYSSAAVSGFKSITSTYSEVAPHVGDYEYAYDMWINGVASSGSNEVMIWTDNFGQTPAGSRFATVVFGGVTYNVYATSGNSYIAFVPTVNSASGSVDILSMLNWLIGQGRLKSTSVIDQIDYGVEICSTAGSSARFDVNGFSLATS